jgi:glycosyltransferase involved in cell wall biosynthesis
VGNLGAAHELAPGEELLVTALQQLVPPEDLAVLAVALGKATVGRTTTEDYFLPLTGHGARPRPPLTGPEHGLKRVDLAATSLEIAMRWLIGAPFRVLKTQFNRLRATTVPNRVLGAAVSVGALFALTALALAERVRTIWRRLRGRGPRLVWGPTPILNIKYWSRAMREAGYESVTCVTEHYAINRREDFDVYRDEFAGRRAAGDPRTHYRFFAWALRHGDVFIRFFDLGFLRFTPLQWVELPLTRLAGKRTIVTPYGGDIAVAGHLGRFEEATFADYPGLPGQAELIKRQVLHTLRWADLSIRSLTIGFMPSWDAVCVSLLGIDTGLWPDVGPASDSDGRDRDVVVVHAPNHRRIKGTEFLEGAVADLQAEGLRIRLDVLERRSNEEVRAAVLASDIVADQFLGGYGLFALEGMAAGKPVLSALDWLREDISAALEQSRCPIVNTSTDRLRDDLRRLVRNPELRRELGHQGRDFVMRRHSYEANGEDWEAFVQHAWTGRPLPDRFRPQPDRVPSADREPAVA